jgi:hypothetical protein
MKMIGKPDSGKLNVRFDEGELEIEPSATTSVLYSTLKRCEIPFLLNAVGNFLGVRAGVGVIDGCCTRCPAF